MSAHPLAFLEEKKTSSKHPLSFLEEKEPEIKKKAPSFGEALAFQTQLPQAGGGALTPKAAKEAAIQVGTIAAVEAAFAPLYPIAAASPYFPRILTALTSLTQAGTTGLAVPTVEALAEGKLPDEKTLMSEGLTWVAIDAAMQAAHIPFAFAKEINRLSKKYGMPATDVLTGVIQGYFKKAFGKTHINPEEITPQIGKEIYDFAKAAEKDPTIIETPKAEKPVEKAADTIERPMEVTIKPEEKAKVEEKAAEPEKPKKEAKPVEKAEKPTIVLGKPKKGNFEISRKDEAGKEYKEKVKGDIYSDQEDNPILGIDKRKDVGYTVSHIPTGLKISNFPDAAAAKYFAERAPQFFDPVNLRSSDLNEATRGADVDKLKALKQEAIDTTSKAKEAAKQEKESKEQAAELKKQQLKKEPFEAKPTIQKATKEVVTGQQKYILDKIDQALNKPTDADYIDIHVPKDGVFRVINTPTVLEKMRDKVAKHWPTKPLPTAPGMGKSKIPTYRSTGVLPEGVEIISHENVKAEGEHKKDVEAKKATKAKVREKAISHFAIRRPKDMAKKLEEGENPDTEKMEDLEEMKLSPDDRLRAQAFAEIQLMKDKIAQKMQGLWAKIDVEAPFKAVGAKDTGHAVKTFYDVKNAYLEEAKGVIKKLQELKLTKDEYWEAMLAAESQTVPANPKVNEATILFREYFDKSFQKYQEEGGLTLPWPQSAIERNKADIATLKTKAAGKNVTPKLKKEIAKEIRELKALNLELEKLKYIPKSASLITQALAETIGDVDPVKVRKFAIAAHHKRKTGALADWIKARPEIKKLLHPYDFIRDYAQKKGNDIALLKIMQAAIKDGLATKGEALGFKMNPITFPALSGYTMHPALFEYLTNLANPLPFNTYDKISRWAKGAIVFDPLYAPFVLLPFFRAVITHPSFLGKPQFFKDAVTGYLNQTPEYIEFVELGGASNPFPETTDFADWVEKAKAAPGSLPEVLKNMLLTKAGLKDLHNKMADFTWNIERIGRFAYYKMLVEKGLDKRDAAKLAAENFTDYSKMPAGTRRLLGRLFFAPVYQVLSMVFDVAMAASPFRLARSFLENKENFKNDKINKERVGLLVGTLIALFGIDALYQSMGYKREEFGTKYIGEFEDENGKRKELVITPTHNLNVTLRWANTFLRGFEPGETTPLSKLWGRLVNQLGPIPSWALELSQNKTKDGKQIWNTTADSYPEAIWKVAKFTAGKIEPFVVSKFWTPEEKRASNEQLKADMGWTYYLMESLQFVYERGEHRQRVKFKIKKLKAEMRKLAREGNLTDAKRDRYIDAINELRDSL